MIGFVRCVASVRRISWRNLTELRLAVALFGLEGYGLSPVALGLPGIFCFGMM